MPKKWLRMYFFKELLVCFFLILLINSKIRTNERKNSPDILRNADTSDFLSLEVLNVLQKIEKNYDSKTINQLCSITHFLNRYTLYIFDLFLR